MNFFSTFLTRIFPRTNSLMPKIYEVWLELFPKKIFRHRQEQESGSQSLRSHYLCLWPGDGIQFLSYWLKEAAAGRFRPDSVSIVDSTDPNWEFVHQGIAHSERFPANLTKPIAKPSWLLFIHIIINIFGQTKSKRSSVRHLTVRIVPVIV